MEQQEANSAGRVFDIGYQRYLGPREGRDRARFSIFVDGLKTSLGIGRGGWAKFVPWLLIAPPIFVGLGFALVAAVAEQALGEAGEELDLPSHLDLFSATGIITMLFAAVMGPELTCPDRRQGVMHLYLVRPITMLDYLGARWLAFLAIMVGVLVIPHVTFIGGIAFGVSDLGGYFRDNWLDIPRFLGASLLLAMFVNSFVFLVSSLTDRRMIATLIAIGIVFVSSVVFESIGAAVNSEWIDLLSLIGLSFGTIGEIVFGEYPSDADLPAFVPLAWYVLLIVVFTAATWRIYESRT